MTEYEPVIGLEIHVQLKTKTKMFCSCALSFGEQPNTYTCSVCLGHPGTLPVVNRQAIEYGLMIAAALECEAASKSIFHRKNYFYPDLPKGYQISQYDVPLASRGRLGDVRVHRVHLEEDAAKLVHVGQSGRIHGAGSSQVDFNRAGTPLVEIVTEPDIASATEAKAWLQLLRTTLKEIGVSDVNMEEGSLRCDANISLRPVGSSELGTKAELKNMNSFRFIERGIDAEIARQRDLLESGAEVAQETLHFDPNSGSLTTLRSKEEAHDYRYFPEPDLVPVVPSEEMLAAAREALPELPAAKEERYLKAGVPEKVARIVAWDSEYSSFYDRAMLEFGDGVSAKGLADLLTNDVIAQGRELGLDPTTGRAAPVHIAEIQAMRESGALTSTASKTVISISIKEGIPPTEIVEREGLGAISDSSELEAIVVKAIEANPEAAKQFSEGNEKAAGRIVGTVMKETQGRADGGLVNKLIREKIGS